MDQERIFVYIKQSSNKPELNGLYFTYLFFCSELIIRCIDRRLETLTIFDNESLELFLHDHIVSLWGQSGWMTAK